MKVLPERYSRPTKTHWLARAVEFSGAEVPAIRQEIARLMVDYELRHQGRSRSERSHAVSSKLIKKGAIKACGMGGITVASALLPGLGTLTAAFAGTAADLAYVTKVQMELCYGIAAAYEVEMDDEELKAVAVALLGFSRSALAAKHIAASALKSIIDNASALYLRKGIGKGVVELAEKLSPRLLSRTFRLIPFVGIPINASINAALVISVGKQARKYFSTWTGELSLEPPDIDPLLL